VKVNNQLQAKIIRLHRDETSKSGTSYGTSVIIASRDELMEKMGVMLNNF
jgi:hypothetical protein